MTIRPIARRTAALSLLIAAGSATLIATSAAAGPIFAPGTKPEAIQRFHDKLAEWYAEQGVPVDSDRFTPGQRALAPEFVFADERGVDPRDRDIEIWWSYAEPGLAMESTNGSLNAGGFGMGQSTEPFGPGVPGYANFGNSLFGAPALGPTQLPPPFGWAGVGGQAAWQQIIADAFDRWAEISGIQFIFFPVGGNPVSDTENGDSGEWDITTVGWPTLQTFTSGNIRIAMADIDGPSQPDGSAGNILAWVYEPRYFTDTSVPGAPGDEPDTVRIGPGGLPGDPYNPPDCLEDPGADPNECIQTVGYAGNIILDRQERWNDPGTPNLLASVIVRAIGAALGLNYACPSSPAEPFSVMQLQEATAPLPPFVFTTPQEDDIRAIQWLYGDPLETNNIYTDAREIVYQPVPGSNVFIYAPHLGIPASEFPNPTVLSISQAVGTDFTGFFTPDIDRFRIVIPDNISVADLVVTVEPRGTPQIDQETAPPTISGNTSFVPASCIGPVFAVNPVTNQRLRIIIETFDPFANTFTLLADEDRAEAGEVETVTLPVPGGIYYITVLGDGEQNTQLYDFTVQVTTEITEGGEEVFLVADALGVNSFYDIGAFGAAAIIATIDGPHISEAHLAFSGRFIPRVAWPGVIPAVTAAGSHPTSVAAVAAGDVLDGFAGLAPDAQLASASVAVDIFDDGSFAVGKTALYYALFGLADRNLARSNGLDDAASVIVNTWSAGGQTRNGDDSISQAFDATVAMTGVTIVAAAGNNGRAEGRLDCGGPPGALETDPGQQFLGSRTVQPPATAFNVISVGALGQSETGDFDLVAGFSAKGPIDSSTFAAGVTEPNSARAGIHLVAPGTGMTPTPPIGWDDPQTGLDPCDYRGPAPTTFLTVPAIAPGDDPENPLDPAYLAPNQGTSIAAGFVAGAIALLQDAAATQSPALSTAPEVMKAILLTGAVKLPGWANVPNLAPVKPQDQRDGMDPNPLTQRTRNTTFPLDIAQGAGRLDLTRSLEIYLTGYPPAVPPQANFDGPTIDPPETNPAVPTIRRPRETRNEPPIGGRDSVEPDAANDATASRSIEDALRLLDAAAGSEPERIIGRPLQVRPDPDLKGGLPPLGPAPGVGPIQPAFPPRLPGGGGPLPGVPGGGGTPPPGLPQPDGGVTPREIDVILVDPIGWDHANIDQRAINNVNGTPLTAPTGFIDYLISVPLLGPRPDPTDPLVTLPGDELTVTLCWLRTIILENINFSNLNDPRVGSVRSLELENLDLEIFLADALGNIIGDEFAAGTPIASSRAELDNIEHISFTIPQDGIYLIRVRWFNTEYDVFANLPSAETRYGLAWRVDFSPRPQAGRAYGMSQLVQVVQSYGKRIGEEGYEITADADTNGRIDFQDIVTILSNWK